ncbi:MAG: hypothetical protein LBF28_03415 [Rickettsiales bacterium]|nr:hypothetical protein [Rickettsiales bacterium]
MPIRILFFAILCLSILSHDAAAAVSNAAAGCAPTGTSCSGCTTYRCDAGYYGDGETCASCVTATGHSSATSAKGSTEVTQCYLPAGTDGSDMTGDWEITGGDCNYSEQT